jgi:chromosome segregation ATPase
VTPTETIPLDSPTRANEDVSSQFESLRLENERLRCELNTHQTEISVLRGERDSLMKTISKLDIELTQAEYQRIAQQQPSIPKSSKKS